MLWLIFISKRNVLVSEISPFYCFVSVTQLTAFRDKNLLVKHACATYKTRNLWKSKVEIKAYIDSKPFHWGMPAYYNLKTQPLEQHSTRV
jgi:hypothetical protein